MNNYTIKDLFGKYPNDMIKKAKNIKLLTHTDMDGSGAAVLMKYLNSLDPFFGLEIVRVHSNQTDAIIRRECLTNWDESYDLVLITDISCTRKTAQEIVKSGHAHKVVLLDHHKSAIDENLNQFGFCTIVAEGSAEDSVVRTNGKHPRNSSGTSLLYDFLKYEGVIEREEYLRERERGVFRITLENGPTACLSQLADSVAAYDTWDWQNIPEALVYRERIYKILNAMFWYYGAEAWEAIHLDRASRSVVLPVTEEDKIIYDVDQKKCAKTCENALAGMKVYNASYVVGYNTVSEDKKSPVYMPYKTALCAASAYIADVFEAMKKAVPDAEIYMILRDSDSISMRTDKDIDLSNIAKLQGGGGHKAAAGISLKGADIVNTALRITSSIIV